MCNIKTIELTRVDAAFISSTCYGMRGSSLGQQFGESFSRVSLLSSQFLSHPAIVTAGRREGLKKRRRGQIRKRGRDGERKGKRKGGR